MDPKTDEELRIQRVIEEVYRKYDEQEAYIPRPFSEYNVSLKDINEQVYIDLSFDDIEHLSEAEIPSRPFPVTGRVYGPSMRLAVPLVFREFHNPESKTLNVWCFLDTTSVYTCLSVKTLEAFFGKGNVKETLYSFQIQKSACPINVYVSKVGSEFEHANIIGMHALDRLRVSTVFNIRKKQITLVDAEVDIEIEGGRA
ncbi:hypothetical protein CAEBREN_13950 [Caenorhabditis brenneri]|uniref:Uncharacterized protein n=1 Tax=Caenorhabditis brenneri TaxID=135651 RepID=G0MQ43_CAEBE|nr:hypothetical protein CAEBREN_13950 [Caenorhabditis brenneri]